MIISILTGLGILTALLLGLWGSLTNLGIYLRIGSGGAGLSMVIGFVYFGAHPLFGGRLPEEAYFGCAMVSIGGLMWVLFRALSCMLREWRKTQESLSDLPPTQ